MSSNEEKAVSFLTDILGFDKDKQAKKIEDTILSKKITKKLLEIQEELASFDADVKNSANLIYELSTRLPVEGEPIRPTILKWIIEGKVKNTQFDAIMEYIRKNGKSSTAMKLETIEKECGVGVEVTLDEIKSTIAELLKSKESELKEKRYQMVSLLHAELRKSLKWADRAAVATELNEQLLKLLGPKGKNEIQKNKKTKDDPKRYHFPDPKDNVQRHPDILKKHLEATNGMVVTRFPPEPNGYLHIGHAKAMNLNFGFAKEKNGICLLRFDDTNPEAESQEYIDSIIDTVQWLGHKPHTVTYASDYFETLFELGVQLIKSGKAYVCHQKPEEYRNENNPDAKKSPWRDRPIEESLKLFEDMRAGKFKEGEAALRMKMDFDSPNPCMWDLVAFRIKYHPHPRTGDRYCVYPTYDFTHCLNDSLENITHSLCTLEFVARQDSYYWLIDALGMYRPYVWEYGRLNITHTLLSKRRLIKLVNGGYVKGWDDPRMPTIVGFRRRGYTPESINKFCEEIGVTRSDNVVVDYSRLENCLRADLENKAIRAMAVLEPLKLTIKNFETRTIERPNIPKNKEAGTNTVTMTNTVYIERKDFKEEDVKDYFGLALKTKDNEPKWVRLKYGPIITVTDVKRNENGEIIELIAEAATETPKKVSGTIHWVSFKEDGSEPDTAEIRLYSHLFKSEHIFKLKGNDWINDINRDSLKIVKGYIDPTLTDLKPLTHFQFERIGYFVVDYDSQPGKPVFNLSTGLREAKEAKAFKSK